MKRTAVDTVLGVDREGRQAALGHWIGDGVGGSTFWTSVAGERPARGVNAVLSAGKAGLTSFPGAWPAVFTTTVVQRGLVHPIRHRLNDVVDQDQEAFSRDRKAMYQAPRRDRAETARLNLAERWAAT